MTKIERAEQIASAVNGKVWTGSGTVVRVYAKAKMSGSKVADGCVIVNDDLSLDFDGKARHALATMLETAGIGYEAVS